MARDEDGWRAELRSFGRRRGRKLSPRQQDLIERVLPAVRLDLCQAAGDRIEGLFGGEARAIWLEIGFGGGEHLVWQAERNPGIGIIGCEPYEDGVVKLLAAVEERGLHNVRIHPDDARAVLRWLPPASVDRAFILFPDPWPKARHRKRRLVNASTLGMLARALRPGAELRLATDIGDYARTMLMAIAATPALEWTAASAEDWRRRPADWPATRYEQKALREGRRCIYLRLVRR